MTKQWQDIAHTPKEPITQVEYLELMTFILQQRVSNEFAADMEVKAQAEYIFEAMNFTVRARFWTHQGDVVTLPQFATWWDHWKGTYLRKLPHWIRKWIKPPQIKKIELKPFVVFPEMPRSFGGGPGYRQIELISVPGVHDSYNWSNNND